MEGLGENGTKGELRESPRCMTVRWIILFDIFDDKGVKNDTRMELLRRTVCE